jgi:hypothetical protein
MFVRVADVGRILLLFAAVLAAIGLALVFADRIPWLGRLPGDVVVRRGPITFYAPIATSIVVSIVLTILLNLFWRR